MPGPNKKPTQLKSISGTDRPFRREDIEVDFEPLSDMPPHPHWLPNPHAVEMWNELGSILIANKILTNVSINAFAHLCAIHGKIVALWIAQETPPAAMYTIFNKLVDSFGIVPAAMGKIKMPGMDKKKNPFDKHGKK